jgi:hypothetical protein
MGDAGILDGKGCLTGKSIEQLHLGAGTFDSYNISIKSGNVLNYIAEFRIAHMSMNLRFILNSCIRKPESPDCHGSVLIHNAQELQDVLTIPGATA